MLVRVSPPRDISSPRNRIATVAVAAALIWPENRPAVLSPAGEFFRHRGIDGDRGENLAEETTTVWLLCDR